MLIFSGLMKKVTLSVRFIFFWYKQNKTAAEVIFHYREKKSQEIYICQEVLTKNMSMWEFGDILSQKTKRNVDGNIWLLFRFLGSC